MFGKERFGYKMENGQRVLLGPGMAGNTFEGWVQLGVHGDSSFQDAGDSPEIPAALKVFSGGFDAHDTSGGALKREVMLLSRLDHPHIVKFLRFFRDGHQPIIATRLVQGKTLHERVAAAFQDNTDPGDEWYSEVLEWGFHLAWVLDYLKQCDIIHRDIKPANIMIQTEDSRPVLLDFGIGRQQVQTTMAGRTGNMPQTTISRGSFVGTPHFASPEQFTESTAEGMRITPAADVFSLGVTLAYAMCPDVVNLQDMVERADQRHYDLSMLPPVQGLRTLIEQMLSIAPEARPTAREVAERLFAIVQKRFGRLMMRVSVMPPPSAQTERQLPSFRDIGRGVQVATSLLNHYMASYYDPQAVEIIDAEDNERVERRDYESVMTLLRKINEQLVCEEWHYQLMNKDEWSAAVGYPRQGMAWKNQTRLLEDAGEELEWLRENSSFAAECRQTAYLSSDHSPDYADRHEQWPKGAIRLSRIPRAEQTVR